MFELGIDYAGAVCAEESGWFCVAFHDFWNFRSENFEALMIPVFAFLCIKTIKALITFFIGRRGFE